ncbi:DUF222 domain-containing protein [Jatrophihabitans sp. YIM 134969]
MVELDEMVPSLDLLRTLTSLVPCDLQFDEQLAAVAAYERMLSWLTAEQNDLLAAIEQDDELLGPGWHQQSSARWRAEQVGLALGVTGSAAHRRMHTAVTLVEKLPTVTGALRVGAITSHHARVVARDAAVLDDEVAHAVEAAVMSDPAWRTPSQLERAFARVVHEVDPERAARRHERARRGRRVSLRAEPDGMSCLWALLSAEQGQLVHKTLDAYARSSKARNVPGDDRTLDERRTDALVDLVTRRPGAPAVGVPTSDGDACDCGSTGDDSAATDATSEPTAHGRRAEIHVTVAWSTLIGADDAPADLTGYGPIDAATARRIAFDPTSTWRRLLVDPESGQLLDYGRRTYAPPQHLQDFCIARDQQCRFPTCDKPAVMCDLDHRLDWERGGCTCDTNLDPLCRNHHRLKHEAGWTHQREADTGDSIWTDPSGTEHVKAATRLPTPRPVEPPAAPATPDVLGDPPF